MHYIVETFRNPGEPSSAPVRVRPCSGQDLSLSIRAECFVNAGFTLEPMVNVSGPSAVILPVGLAPGNLRRISMSPASMQSKFSESCFTQRNLEHVSLEIPGGIALTQMPKNASFKQGVYSYSAKYLRKNNVIQAERQLTIQRPECFCASQDEADWQALAHVLKRDLRSQVFTH